MTITDMNQTSPKSQNRRIITLVQGLSHRFGYLKTRWVIHRLRIIEILGDIIWMEVYESGEANGKIAK